MNNSKIRNLLALNYINQINKFDLYNIHNLVFLKSLNITITPNRKKKKMFHFYIEAYKLIEFLSFRHGFLKKFHKKNSDQLKGKTKTKKNLFNVMIILNKKNIYNFFYQYILFCPFYFDKKFVNVNKNIFFSNNFSFLIKDINAFPGVIDNFMFLESKLYFLFKLLNNQKSLLKTKYMFSDIGLI